MENSPKINTAQNVNIYINLADTSKRILGILLDRLFIVVYIIFICIITFGIMGNSPEMLNPSENTVFFFSFFVIVLLPYMFYFLIFPVLMQGQTPGKRIIGTRIVREDGGEAGFGNFFVRWLLDIVDIYIFGAMVGLIVMLVTKKRQRVADLVAKTVVINTKIVNKGQRPDFEKLAEEYNPVFLQVLQLSDKDVRIIREAFERAKRNQNAEILKKLRTKIEEVIIETKPEMTDEQYVDTVLKDYRYFAEK